jgi:hypothetical protein
LLSKDTLEQAIGAAMVGMEILWNSLLLWWSELHN